MEISFDQTLDCWRIYQKQRGYQNDQNYGVLVLLQRQKLESKEMSPSEKVAEPGNKLWPFKAIYRFKTNQKGSIGIGSNSFRQVFDTQELWYPQTIPRKREFCQSTPRGPWEESYV